jgi:hypothetical protein
MARLALLCLVLAASGSHASAPDPALLGCWRAVKIVLHTADGAKSEDTTGRCTLHYQDTRYVSTCGTTAGRAVTTTYDYRVTRPGVYLATMTASTFKTDLLGASREYEYRVTGDSLVTVSQAPGAAPGPRTGGRVELEAAKMPCP